MSKRIVSSMGGCTLVRTSLGFEIRGNIQSIKNFLILLQFPELRNSIIDWFMGNQDFYIIPEKFNPSKRSIF